MSVLGQARKTETAASSAIEDLKRLESSIVTTAAHVQDNLSKVPAGAKHDQIMQSQRLAGEALQNFVDQVNVSSAALTSFLDLQLNAVEQLELSAESLAAVRRPRVLQVCGSLRGLRERDLLGT